MHLISPVLYCCNRCALIEHSLKFAYRYSLCVFKSKPVQIWHNDSSKHWEACAQRSLCKKEKKLDLQPYTQKFISSTYKWPNIHSTRLHWKMFFPSLSDFLNVVLFKGKALSIIQQHLSCHRKVIIVNKHKRRIQNNDWHFCLSFKSQLVSVNFQITSSQKCSRKTNYFSRTVLKYYHLQNWATVLMLRGLQNKTVLHLSSNIKLI